MATSSIIGNFGYFLALVAILATFCLAASFVRLPIWDLKSTVISNMSIWNLLENFCCTEEVKSFDAEVQSFGEAMRKFFSNVQHNRISKWQKTDRGGGPRTKMKGKVLTFWKRWFSTVVELQSIWHVKSAVVKCILLLFLQFLKVSPFSISRFIMRFSFLTNFNYNKNYKEDNFWFFFYFFHIITSSIYRFSQKKRIGLIIENSIEMRVG